MGSTRTHTTTVRRGQLNARDTGLLRIIAEHRVVTARQLAALLGRNVRALRRRLRHLVRLEHVSRGTSPRGKRGRPEATLSLSEQGVSLLAAAGYFGKAVVAEAAMLPATPLQRHTLAVNSVRAQLALMERLIPSLAVEFLCPTSPFLSPDGRSPTALHDRLVGAEGRRVEFVPDGVFAVTHAQLAKTLLFFLEVDLATESLRGGAAAGCDVWRKVVTYQAYYASDHYKRFEKIFRCKLGRFRVLFVAKDPARAAAICTLVRELARADFILISDMDSAAEKGIWAPIWILGGRLDQALVSILGSKMPEPPPRTPWPV